MNVKGVPFVNRRYTKEVAFFVKNGVLKGKGLGLGAESPRINIC